MKILRKQLQLFSQIFLKCLVLGGIISSLPLVNIQAQNLLREPQKIVVDIQHNRLLVSNYDGGDIIEIDNNGKQSIFKSSANFIDGLEIVDNAVYGIGQNRTVNAFDLTTKELISSITIEGNTKYYLSSITYDLDGHLFISCPFQNTIYKYRIKDNKYWVFAKDNGLNKPNGILLEKENNRIVVIDDSPAPSKIHAINLSDSTVSTLAEFNFDRPDGIVKDNEGNYYVGGYYLPGLYKIDPLFKTEPVLFYKGETFVYPTYSMSDSSILITNYGANSWLRIPLTTTLNKQ